jgi:hypothetical protein
LERVRQFVGRHAKVASALLGALVILVAAHQFIRSHDHVLSAWKGGGFGMYTTPHPFAARATVLVIDGNPLQLAPKNPSFEAWVRTVAPSSAAYLGRLHGLATRMRSYPDAAAANRLIALAARVTWDKSLFDTLQDVGRQPAGSIRVVILEIARRPSVGQITSRIVFQEGGE